MRKAERDQECKKITGIIYTHKVCQTAGRNLRRMLPTPENLGSEEPKHIAMGPDYTIVVRVALVR